MAFYPDELSPIDRVRGLGKPPDLPDIGPIKNRRQWKSLVLGKKDMGMNGFATIAEEKEEDISSDGSQGANPSGGNEPGGAAPQGGVVANKKITFPKPRKYITSRVTERKEDGTSGDPHCPGPFAAPSGTSLEAEARADATKTAGGDLPDSAAGPKPDGAQARQPLKAKKSREFVAPEQEFVVNYVLGQVPIEMQWNEAVTEAGGRLPPGWSGPADKGGPSKSESAAQPWKPKQEDKKKSGRTPKAGGAAEAAGRDAKSVKKKGSPQAKKSGKAAGESSTGSRSEKARPDKGKALNMKDVVNVYKNLAYGSKEEIKSFVEKLSFVKDESKTENDKNLLSVMNLKALENKIKNFAKKSGKGQEATSGPQERKSKSGKSAKKNRKAHIDRLARHKVIRVPAVPSDVRPKNGAAEGGAGSPKPSEKKEGKRSPASPPPPGEKDKEPWKYVGMQSVLDKTYFVYPAYPPSVNLRKGPKGGRGHAKAGETKKGGAAPKDAADPEPKVKAPQVVLRQNSALEGGARDKGPSGATRSTNALSLSGSNKSVNRSSATTVCTVEFRPAGGQKTSPAAEAGPADRSLLLYLHGTKAINVRSPYSDRQFSRVKFFRKDERGAPLIRGPRRPPATPSEDAFVRNISLPEQFARVRSLDLLDFDDDIQNINEFLRSNGSSAARRREDGEDSRKSERRPREPPSEEPPGGASRPQRRRRRSARGRRQRRHQHPQQQRQPQQRRRQRRQHGTARQTLTPDSIVEEICDNIQHLQYLPDTEDNRKTIAWFFDELDRRIEASRGDPRALSGAPPLPASFGPVPILGY